MKTTHPPFSLRRSAQPSLEGGVARTNQTKTILPAGIG